MRRKCRLPAGDAVSGAGGGLLEAARPVPRENFIVHMLSVGSGLFSTHTLRREL